MAERIGALTDALIAVLEPPGGPCAQAGDIITSVRDMIPDPQYDEAGQPLPDADGSFLRASSLYRWLSNGIRELARRSNWMVIDWTASAQRNRQPLYALDARFVNVDSCFCNAYRLIHLDEVHTIYPSVASAQPLWFSWHTRTDRLELYLWPWPDREDPVALLAEDLGATSDLMALTSTEGFLPFGFLRINGELIQYFNQFAPEVTALPPALIPTPPPVIPSLALSEDEVLLATPLQPRPPAGGFVQALKRGAGGTSAEVHYAGARVEHLSIWSRGTRSPAAVRRSTDCVEIPLVFTQCLETYLLAQVKKAEQDLQGAQLMSQMFLEEVQSIVTDPSWQQTPWPSQVRAYGEAHAGSGLYAGRVVVP